MVKRIFGWAVGFVVISAPIVVIAQESTSEFAIKRRYQMERIEDFYTRLNDLERMEAARRKGESEMRELRKEIAKRNEAARQEFIRERKMKPPENPLSWEKELKEMARARELARQEYVRQQKELEKAIRSAGQIPEEDEFDINTDFEAEL